MGDVVCVACVVDSSLAVHAQWPRVLTDYITPLLSRLHDSGRTLKLAFVCYASAPTQPSPLLSKLGFVSSQIIVKDLKDDPGRLGIGHTGSGGGRGMAVLEGLVAALELIDIFRLTAEKAVCHIIHVAASPPDAAERPLWNMSPRLDSITWDSLPQELHKREIKYSHILLNSIQKLSTFHLHVTGNSGQTPWFPVRPHHSVRLAVYPSPKAAGVKRPHETPSSQDAIHEAKRPRVLSATQSPKPNPSPKASSPPHPQPSPSPMVPPANVIATSARPNAMVSFTPATFQRAIERMAETEKLLKQKISDVTAFQQGGRIQEAEALRAQIQPTLQSYKKMKFFMEQARAKLVQDQLNPQQAAGAGQTGPAFSTGNSGAIVTTAVAPLAPALNNFPPDSTSQQQNLAVTPDGSAPIASASSDSQPPRPPLAVGPPQGLNKAQDMQLQKLMEQQQRLTPHISAAGPSASQPSTISGPSAVAAQGQPIAGISPALGNKSWEGTLTWRGLEHATHARTDMQTRVMLISAPNQELNRPETWPMTLSLAPSKERSIPWYLLQDWLKRANAVPFLLQPRDIVGEDKSKNEEHFRALIRLLTEKKTYALSGWQGPDGHAQQLMIFHTKGGLAGGYFAEGIPEMPATHILEIELESVPPPIALVLVRLPAGQVANLSKLSMDKRRQWLAAMAVKTQQAQLHAQGMGGHPVPGVAAAPGAPPMPASMGASGVGSVDGAGGVQAGMTASAMMTAMAGQHQRTGSGNGLSLPTGAINNEMLQSFITRTGQH